MSTDTLPQSPVLFANLIREHVPPSFSVVAIGGNRQPTTVEVLASPSDRETIRWNGDAWVHDEAGVLLTTAGLVAFLHRAFAGYYA